MNLKYVNQNICRGMIDFWEHNFSEKQTMWGFKPAESAILVKDFFVKEKINEILIPGIGYGRNAKIFLENGINVTGIEISETAIRLARMANNLEIPIYHGSVAYMPFDNKLYGGIFSYALIHLLNSRERNKFVSDCYNQLKSGGYMFFTTISKKDSLYTKGKLVSKDRFEVMKGAKLFFYDTESIKKEFEKYGLMDFSEIDEPVKFNNNCPPMKFILIKCKKLDNSVQ
jgi:SAM-dependent methyltransferase